MVITKEVALSDFDFWSSAKETAMQLNDSDFDKIEDALMELYPDGTDECTINDIFWFEEDWIAGILGYDSWEDLLKKRDPDYVDPEERKDDIKSEASSLLDEKGAEYCDYDLDDWLESNWDEDSDDSAVVEELVKYIMDNQENDEDDE